MTSSVVNGVSLNVIVAGVPVEGQLAFALTVTAWAVVSSIA